MVHDGLVTKFVNVANRVEIVLVSIRYSTEKAKHTAFVLTHIQESLHLRDSGSCSDTYPLRWPGRFEVE